MLNSLRYPAWVRLRICYSLLELFLEAWKYLEVYFKGLF